MNFGAFAGGVAQGYSKGIDDKRKQKEQERQDKEYAKQDAYEAERQTVIDSVKNSAANAEKQNQQIAVSNSTARTAADVVRSPAAQGINPLLSAPQSDAELVAPAQNRPAAAAGVLKSSLNQDIAGAINPAPVDQKPIEARPPTMMDSLNLYGKLAEVDLKHGKINGLGMIQAQQAVKQLQNEGIDQAVAQMHHGDIEGGLKTFNDYGQHKGAVLVGQPQKGEYEYGGVKLPTVIATIQMPDGTQQTINTAEYGAARFKMDQTLSAMQKGAEIKQTAKHQDETLGETKRHNIAEEGISRIKSTSSAEGTTAEIKNARTFFPELYGKNPADALSAFRDLQTGEMTAAKVRQSLLTVYSDRMKGGWPTDAGKTESQRDAYLNQRVDFVMGKNKAAQVDPSGVVKAGDVVDGYKFKGGDPKSQESWSKE